jgi:hypothetical protein
MLAGVFLGFEPLEVVAICNHLVAFGATEREYKIFPEALRVSTLSKKLFCQ